LPNESITEDFKACADVAPGGSGQLVEVTSGTLMLLGIADAAALGAKANDEASDYWRRLWCGKLRRAILDQGQRGNNG
jgi:hypothetical protein